MSGETTLIFVKSYRRAGDGKLMVAAHYGLKAFPLKVKNKKEPEEGDYLIPALEPRKKPGN